MLFSGYTLGLPAIMQNRVNYIIFSRQNSRRRSYFAQARRLKSTLILARLVERSILKC